MRLMNVVQFARGHAGEVAALCRDEGWDSWDDIDRVTMALSAPGAQALVAMEGDAVVGAIQVLGDGAISWVVGMLIVAPGSRRRGIATRLISEAFRCTGARRLDLLTEDEGPQFYRRLSGRPMMGFRLYPE
jgi:ribosomal protein S18 acetylase RimI-like enzyme